MDKKHLEFLWPRDNARHIECSITFGLGGTSLNCSRVLCGLRDIAKYLLVSEDGQ